MSSATKQDKLRQEKVETFLQSMSNSQTKHNFDYNKFKVAQQASDVNSFNTISRGLSMAEYKKTINETNSLDKMS